MIFTSGPGRCLIKSERYFDLYDRAFAHHFRGVEFLRPRDFELSEVARALLEDWLKDPQRLADFLGIDEDQLRNLTPEELLKYFMDRLKEQTEAHHGGSKWIGTGGTSPVGHSGFHPGGMRVGGMSRNKSAVKVAMERRYKDYSQEGPSDPGPDRRGLETVAQPDPDRSQGPGQRRQDHLPDHEKRRGDRDHLRPQPQGPPEGHPGDGQRRLVHGSLYRALPDPV